MTSLLLVTNPSSGSSDEDAIASLTNELRRLGRVDHLEPSSQENFNEEVSGAARDHDVIVVAGGDGTLNCAINALEDQLARVRIGLIPMGTGNDLARTLGIPTDPEEAARAVVSGTVRTIDVGVAEGANMRRLFVNACIGGFPIRVNEEIDEDTKRRFGAAAFWLGGAKAAAELARTTVTMNGTVVEDCLAVGVGNGRTAGGGIEVWPEAVPDDGLLEATALPASGHVAAGKLALKVRSGDHLEMDEVKRDRAARVEIASDPPIEINVDGELLGLKTPATFSMLTTARFLVSGS